MQAIEACWSFTVWLYWAVPLPLGLPLAWDKNSWRLERHHLQFNSFHYCSDFPVSLCGRCSVYGSVYDKFGFVFWWSVIMTAKIFFLRLYYIWSDGFTTIPPSIPGPWCVSFLLFRPLPIKREEGTSTWNEFTKLPMSHLRSVHQKSRCQCLGIRLS